MWASNQEGRGTYVPVTSLEEKHSEKRRLFARLLREPSVEDSAVLTKKAPKQAEVLEALKATGEPVVAVAFSVAALKALHHKGWIEITDEPVARDPHQGETFVSSKSLAMNGAQHEALVTVAASPPAPLFRIRVLKDVGHRPSVKAGTNVPSYSGGLAAA